MDLGAGCAGGQKNFALESATDEVAHAIGMYPLNSVCVARRSASKRPCKRESGRQSEALPRQRMDFLLVAPDRSRLVLRSTGFNTTAGQTGPTRRAGHTNRVAAHVWEMVANDRRLRLGGYGDFFITLLTRHQKATP